MVDDFIRAFGNLAYVNTWLKLIAFALLILCLTLAALLAMKVMDSRVEHIVPIVINSATGDALVVDHEIVDANGEERAPVEIRKFCEDFLSDAYTYNRFTVRSHLDSLARWSAPEALTQVRESLDLPRRAELVGRNAQGLSELSSFMIIEAKPLLRAQVYFHTRVFASTGETLDEKDLLAVLTIKPIRRSARNPHGLIVIEYRQSPFKSNSEDPS